MKQTQVFIFLYFCWLSAAFAQPVVRGTHEVSSYNQVVSIPVTVEHFTDILSMRYSVNWNPELLEFISLTEIGGISTLGNDDFNFAGVTMGNFVMDWDDSHPVIGTTIPDFTQLYKMNFLVRGGPGTCAEISFTNSPSLIYVRRVSTGNSNIGLLREPGKVIVPQAPCRSEDSLALVELYNQTNGWLWHNAWDLNQPMDSWDGVIISPISGCVETLDLDGVVDDTYSSNGNGRNLVGTLPDLILPSIKKIYLSHNSLTGNIPNFTHTTNLEELTLNNNEFSFSPTLNSTPVLRALFVQDNELTFDDIIPNMDVVANEYLYAEQAWVYEPLTVSVAPGANHTIDLGIDPNMTDNVYHWWKDGVDWTTITGSNKLEITNITSAETGVYTCEITNPQAPDLTLFSHPVTIELNCEPDLTSLAATICQGITYEMAGVEYAEAGFYEATLTNALGCDSMIQLSLAIMPPMQSNRNESICEGEAIVIDGNDYSEAGFYPITLTTAEGCDSIVNLNLTVNTNETNHITASICDGQSYMVGTSVYTEAGDYEDNLMTEAGCDSTVFLNLSVADFSETFLDENICEGDAYVVGTSVYTESGEYEDMLTTMGGCDSIVYLQLEVVEILEEALTVTVCDGESYAIGNTNFDETGVYEGVVSSSEGCDSMVFLNLIVNEPIVNQIEASICTGGTYTVGTSTYTEAGQYEDILTTPMGCDSLVLLDLSITTILETHLDIQLCEGETFPVGDDTYDEAGDYENSLIAESGCDSIVYLSLSYNDVEETFLQAAICEGTVYTVGHTDYSETGTHETMLSTIHGCDSLVVLDLEMLPVIESSETATICAGETYSVGENTYQQTGEYMAVLTTVDGCDSMVHLSLTVVDEATFGQAVAGEPQMVCGEEVTLIADVPMGAFGYWQTEGSAMIENDESATTTVQHLETGANVFTWTLSTEDCPDFSSASVIVHAQNQVPQAVTDSIRIEYGDNFTTINLLENDELNEMDNWTFQFLEEPSRGIVRENEPGIIDFSSSPGYYGIAYFSYELCNTDCPNICTEAEVFIRVDQPEGEQPSIIITPNGDGLNETLVFDDLPDYPGNELVITNRWGSVVYQIEDYQNDWLGQNQKGQLLPEGTYYYMMQFEVSEGNYQIGSVTVKR